MPQSFPQFGNSEKSYNKHGYASIALFFNHHTKKEFHFEKLISNLFQVFLSEIKPQNNTS
jgi:hypothetical protein